MFNKIKTFRENAWYSNNPLVVVIVHPIGMIRMIIAACKARAEMANKYPSLWDEADTNERVRLIIYAMYRNNPEWIKLVTPETQECFKNWVEQTRAELEAQ